MKGILLIFILLLAPLSFAQLGSTTAAISSFCASLMSLLPVAAMLLVMLAAVIYAAGQVMGAETRARANVWATACATGALMGILISVVTQPVLTAIYGQSVSCSGPSGVCGSVMLPSSQHCCSGIGCSNTRTCSGSGCSPFPMMCLGGKISCNGVCYSPTSKCCWGIDYPSGSAPPGC